MQRKVGQASSLTHWAWRVRTLPSISIPRPHRLVAPPRLRGQAGSPSYSDRPPTRRPLQLHRSGMLIRITISAGRMSSAGCGHYRLQARSPDRARPLRQETDGLSGKVLSPPNKSAFRRNPEGFQKVAGGRGARSTTTPPVKSPKARASRRDASRAEHWSGPSGTLPGCDLSSAQFRGCRCAQSPATDCQPFGLKMPHLSNEAHRVARIRLEQSL
jgi:hypothetical protein